MAKKKTPRKKNEKSAPLSTFFMTEPLPTPPRTHVSRRTICLSDTHKKKKENKNKTLSLNLTCFSRRR